MRKLINSIRPYVHGVSTGVIISLGFYVTHWQPPVYTLEQEIDHLALHMDSNNRFMWDDPRGIPVPKSKPEVGYTLAARQDFNGFIEGFVR